tara:strand:+ start:12807 stop:13448 length:642 start_codon:yes stop_codon:yes gene_type:complete
MKNFEDFSSFYNEAIDLIDLNDFEGAIISIKKNIDSLQKPDDIALAFLSCGFLSDKLGDYLTAINYFSQSINFESELENINQRSKDISYSARSNSRYNNGNYQGSIEDKRQARKIRLLEIDRFPEVNVIKIDYKNILLGTFIEIDLEPKYKTLIKASKIEKSRYDLIEDYKKVISHKRKEQVIEKLEFLSESKYQIGDYKASIRAMRRSEKYY